MTRMRWGLAAAIGLCALISAGQALGTYLTHRLWIGSFAVVVLAAIDLGGFASLLVARRRLGRELDGLESDPPEGELITARRAVLERLRATGAEVDLQALADSATAEETGRAYLGRYLTAVTVLVGLVGTFAGLMETLRRVAPLATDPGRSALELVAAPLAGLDVTFGASIVGILVTLSLALAQGDLVLAEQRALARLAERTTHFLIPALWPPAEAPAERSVRELAAMRQELREFLGAAVEATSTSVAKVAATEVSRLVAGVTAQVDRAHAELAGASAAQASAAVAITQQIKELAQAQSSLGQALLADSAASLLRTEQAMVSNLGAIAQRLSKELETLVGRHAQALETTSGALTSAVAGTEQRVIESLGALAGTQATETARLRGAQEEATRAACDTMGALVARHAQSLETTGSALTSAVAGTEQRVIEALGALVEAQASEGTLLREGQAQATRLACDSLSALVERHGQALEISSATHASAISTTEQRVLEALGALAQAQAREAARLRDQHDAASRASCDTLGSLATRHAETLEATSVALLRGAAATEERVAGALGALAQTQAALVERHAQALETTGGALTSAVAGTEQRVIEALGALAKVQTTEAARLRSAQEEATKSTSGAMGALVERHARALEAGSATLAAAVSGAEQRFTDALSTLAQAQATDSARLRESHSEASRASCDALSQLAQRHAQTLEATSVALLQGAASTEERVVDALGALAGEHARALDGSAAALRETLAQTVGQGAARLDAAASALAGAAEGLRGGAESLEPALTALAPELGALAREVALLSARADAGVDTTLIDELGRLGEGVDRLDALFRMSRPAEANGA